MRALVLMTVVLGWLGLAPMALAGDGVFLVRGNAGSEIRAAASNAMREALREGSWKLPSRAFTEQEVETMAACLGRDKPWACLSATLKDAKLDRVAILTVERKVASDGASLVQLTARIVVAAQDLAYGDEQYCERCTGERAKTTAAALAAKVLDRVYLNSNRTSIEVQTSPPGAKVVVDGTVMGASNLVFDILPGRHSLALSLSGYRDITRSVDVADGEETAIQVRLEPEETALAAAPAKLQLDAKDRATERVLPRWVAPSLMSAGAVSLLIGGGLVLAELDQPKGEVQRQYNVSGPGIGLLAVGAALAGGGLYLWRWPPTRERARKDDGAPPTSSITATPLQGGGLAVFATRF